MIKRTIEISLQPAHLAVQNDQFLLKRGGVTVCSIPCEDLGMVVVDHPQVTYTHAALTALTESGAVVVICGRDHLPNGLLIPLADHSEVVWKIQDQVNVSKPIQKRLWKQIVQAKIIAQARNLTKNSAPRRKLEVLATEVKSGDTANHEAQAAVVYWSSWLVNVDGVSGLPDRPFRRNRDEAGVNSLLNYGYAILRAAVARAIVSAGLYPALGLHHSNRGNPFCLADDLMEPLRPIVDARVRELHWSGHTELDQPTKARLLEILTFEVETNGKTGPLMVSLPRFVASLGNCYRGTSRQLEIPVSCNSVDTAVCG